MKIKRTTYEYIISKFDTVPPEQGGILGMKDGVVCEYIHDNSKTDTDRAVYEPNVSFLNDCISKWFDEGCDFCGIVHSHPRGQDTLSSSDIEYINLLFQMNPWIENMLFPIIVGDYGMTVYVAGMKAGELSICKTSVEFVD